MDTDVQRTVEFGKVREILAGYTVTARGRAMAESLAPMARADAARHALSQTTDLTEAMAEGFALPLWPVEDVRPAARKADAGGGPLEPHVLWRIAACLEAAARISRSLCRLGASYPTLSRLGESIPRLADLVEQIKATVDDTGRVLDGASSELKRLRRRVRSLRGKIEKMLRRLIESPEVRPHLQYPNPTMCRDRYVLPVNAHRKHEVDGLVHGSSDSGATLYVEPMQVIEPGNELSQAIDEAREEVQRILWEVTARVGGRCAEICEAVQKLGKVDLLRAKALMSRAFRMCPPRLVQEHRLELRGARHPLLLRLTCPPDTAAPQQEDIEFGAVVPLDMRLGGDFSMLVITGPNTGGKTVVLKTLGLACLMARAGMHVPADHAVIPLFDGLYADIGDEQSLEQSLSTFSGHMRRIIRILQTATDRSVVLLDELGAGTDPAEGGALGEAVLNRLLGKGCLTVAVTHLGNVKTYAVSRPEVESASMDFDLDTLRPTYHLTVGTVGGSNALEIAERLGVPDDVLAQARGLLDSESAGQYGEMLEQVRIAREDAERRRSRMEYLEQKAAELKEEYESTLARLKAEEERQGADFGLKMRDSLEELHQDAEALYEELRHSHRSVAERVRRVRDGLGELLEDISDLLAGHRLERSLEPGDEVYVTRLHKWGTVERVDEDRQRAKVRAGDAQVEVDVDDLEPWGEHIRD